jgi:hypothetical protein
MAASTKVVTGKVRFSYVQVFQPKSYQGGAAKYSVVLLIPKSDKATIKKIKEAIAQAMEDGVSSKWGGKKPKNLWDPLRDGDEEKADEHPEYAGMYFITAKSDRRPVIVDKDLEEILDPDEFYSGCWGRASINFYPYDNTTKGVAAGLNRLQKLKDDTRFGGASGSVEEDFGDGFEDDEDDDF